MNKDISRAIELFRNYKLDESREILEKIIQIEPENIEALVMLGNIHSRTQNYGVAINHFQKAIDLQPDNTEAITGLQLVRNILQLTNNYYFENPYTDDALYEFE